MGEPPECVVAANGESQKIYRRLGIKVQLGVRLAKRGGGTGR